MKSKIILFAIMSLFFSAILGCDKFNFAASRKTEPKPAVEPVVQAKGPVVAKVNNISIGLDDLNEDIALYNANVPPERPELKIVTRDQKVNYLKRNCSLIVIL